MQSLRLWKYILVKDRKKFHITTPKECSATATLVTATQAKRMVNASGRYTLLMISLIEQSCQATVLSALALSPQQSESNKQHKDYNVLFQEATRLSPKRAVEHDIQLISNAALPNLGLYRTSVPETTEILRRS